MYQEFMRLNEERNVTLTAYLQEVGGEFQNVTKRPAVLVLPGGGYQICSDREADPVAFAYMKAGYQTFILRYSTGQNAAWPNPLNDFEQAMKLIRENADLWHVYEDKIAVIGFSAGGHLAACAATLSKNRPNAAILGYAVTIGGDVIGCNPGAPDTVSTVDRDTCPCFVFAARTDSVVPVVNSTRFIHALAEHDVAFESHIYAFGPHGFSTADSSVKDVSSDICERVPNWVNDSIGWLRDILGEFGNGEMKKPACPRHMNDDGEDSLSVNCTFGHLMKYTAAQAILSPILERVQGDMGGQIPFDNEVVKALMSRMTLQEVFTLGNMPQNIIEELDGRLREIKS